MNNPDIHYRYIDSVITFKKGCEDLESYCEAGMKAKIIGITIVRAEKNESDLVYKVKLDYSQFDDYNKSFETSNYYDKSGVSCMTAREAGFYNVQDTLYLGSDNIWPWNTYFEVGHDSVSNRMFDRYSRRTSDTELSYLKWLETQLSKYI